LIGITLLLVGIGWFAVVSLRLMRKRKDREERSWGLLGIALLVCGGVQSIFDFVLVIPANLILYASLIGIVGAVARSTSHERDSSDRKGDSRRQIFARYSQLPAGWCGIAVCCLTVAFVASSQQICSEQALERTSVTQLDEEPSEATVLANIRTLDRAIETQPQHASLYQRRANWHLAAYRLEVAVAARSEGIDVAWPNTRPENLFALVSSQSHESRGALLAFLLGTPGMELKLVDALTDLSCALSLNPLSPQEHLNCCALAPIVGLPTRPWLDSSAALNNNSYELLYLNGLFAFYSDELDLAVDQWSKSLAINHRFLDSIFELSQQKLPAMRIVTDLVPSSRADLCVRLIQATRRDSGNSDNPQFDHVLSRAIVTHLESTPSVDSGRTHATIAQIWQLLGDHDSAVSSWETALRADAHNAGYRLEYSQSLSRLGRNDEALKQAVLGQTLNPVDKRFERLTARIRQQIRTGSRR
jgi:hypothetical protein